MQKHEDWLEQNWSGLKAPRVFSPVRTTGVALATFLAEWSGLALAKLSGGPNDLAFRMTSVFAGVGTLCLTWALGTWLFSPLAALFSGVLNATGRFAAAAAAPVLLNVILATAMIWAARSGADVGRALTWGVPLAGIAQLALVWIAAARAGFALRLRLPRLSPEMKRLAIIAAPAALAGGVVQVNLLVGRQVASFFEGSIQYLNLADRLYQLPLGVVAVFALVVVVALFALVVVVTLFTLVVVFLRFRPQGLIPAGMTKR